MRTRHVKVAEQGAAVRGLLGDAGRARRLGAAPTAAPAVTDALVSIGQDQLVQERAEGVGDEGSVDDHDGITAPGLLELQRDSGNVGSLHTGAPPRLCIPCTVCGHAWIGQRMCGTPGDSRLPHGSFLNRERTSVLAVVVGMVGITLRFADNGVDFAADRVWIACPHLPSVPDARRARGVPIHAHPA